MLKRKFFYWLTISNFLYIIVLLILAGVTISTLTGENGILNQTNKANMKTSHANVVECIRLAYNEYQIEINTTTGSNIKEIGKIASTEKVKIQGKEEKSLSGNNTTFWDFLKNKNYIDENGVINVSKLVGKEQYLGNGTGNIDVYKIEEEDRRYILKYYGEEDTELLWEVSDDLEGQIDWNTILADAKENPDNWKVEGQESNTIGIGTDGKPVNMDDWAINKINDVYSLSNVTGTGQNSSYLGKIGEDGVLIIPQYIKKEDDDDFCEVAIIGNWAFRSLGNLKNIYIPNTVTTISINAFERCISLTSIEIPSSVTSIGDSAFSGCSSLTSIEIPNSVTEIGNWAFFGCSSLTSIEIPISATTIGVGAFSECSSLTSIEIPSSVTSIGNYAFSRCSSLTSITVDPNNKIYDSRENCNAIIETSSNTLIQGCKNTKIPSSVTSIAEGAFEGCSGLTSIEIPSSVTSIAENVFFGCSGLTSIEIPSSVTSIEGWAFRGCSGLTTVTYKGTKEEWSKITIGSYNGELRNAQIVCTDGTI